MTTPPKDVGASVRARLLNLARERREDFQLIVTRYANERLLYRLTRSEHASGFVLKGAALFTLWSGQPHRATRDIDLLGFGEPSSERLRSVFADIINADVEDDGIRFDESTLEVGPLREEQEYGGVRILLVAQLTTARVRLQIDVGFGDAITPSATDVQFPTLLPFPAPMLRAYPRETVVAEKLEAMVDLGQANSRMKDFYDLVVLSQTSAFQGELLARAVAATFARRGTEMPAALPVAFTSEFTEDRTKVTQWGAFLRKSRAPNLGDLAAVAAVIARFVSEPLAAARTGADFVKRWEPGGPWK